jgi:hypothetical protein
MAPRRGGWLPIAAVRPLSVVQSFVRHSQSDDAIAGGNTFGTLYKPCWINDFAAAPRPSTLMKR